MLIGSERDAIINVHDVTDKESRICLNCLYNIISEENERIISIMRSTVIQGKRLHR